MSIHSTSYIEYLARNIERGNPTTVYQRFTSKLNEVLTLRKIDYTRVPTELHKSQNRHKVYIETYSYKRRE